MTILAVRPDLEVVAIADGAEENWRYFDHPLYASAPGSSIMGAPATLCEPR